MLSHRIALEPQRPNRALLRDTVGLSVANTYGETAWEGVATALVAREPSALAAASSSPTSDVRRETSTVIGASMSED